MNPHNPIVLLTKFTLKKIAVSEKIIMRILEIAVPPRIIPVMHTAERTVTEKFCCSLAIAVELPLSGKRNIFISIAKNSVCTIMLRIFMQTIRGLCFFRSSSESLFL